MVQYPASDLTLLYLTKSNGGREVPTQSTNTIFCPFPICQDLHPPLFISLPGAACHSRWCCFTCGDHFAFFHHSQSRSPSHAQEGNAFLAVTRSRTNLRTGQASSNVFLAHTQLKDWRTCDGAWCVVSLFYFFSICTLLGLFDIHRSSIKKHHGQLPLTFPLLLIG